MRIGTCQLSFGIFKTDVLARTYVYFVVAATFSVLPRCLADTPVEAIRSLEKIGVSLIKDKSGAYVTAIVPAEARDGTPIEKCDLSALRKVLTLTEVDAVDCVINDALIETLEFLPDLRRLNLSGTTIDGLRAERKSGFSALRRLILAKSRITDAQIGNLTNVSGLQLLDVSRTRLEHGTLPWIAKLTALEELNLSGTRIVKEEGSLGTLVKLKTLRMTDCRPHASIMESLQGLKGLEELEVKWVIFGGRGEDALTKIVSLRRLNLYGASFSPEKLPALKNLRLLTALDVDTTRNADSDAVLALCRELPTLNVERALLRGKWRISAHFNENGRAVHLLIRSGAQCKLIARLCSEGLLKDVAQLKLEGDDIDDAAVEWLGSLSKLEILDVSATQVSEKTLKRAFTLNHLTDVYVSPANSGALALLLGKKSGVKGYAKGQQIVPLDDR